MTEKGDAVDQSLLTNIQVVLVEPQHPGNIGAVARAMKNMGLSRLVLVNPPENFRGQEAVRMALNGADILEKAQTFSSLEAAIAPMGLVIGTSCRPGKERFPVYTPREIVPRVLATARTNRVALVFGPERSGLCNEHLDLCHLLVRIPSSEAFPSLNLAQAVMVLCYELYAACAQESIPPASCMVPADTVQVEQMYADLQDFLLQIGFLDPQNPQRIMRALRRLFGRAGLTSREVSILRGIIRQVRWYSERGHQTATRSRDLGTERLPPVETTAEDAKG
ncbi:MAG: RNA methyltransferase [Nitrospinota bacterium]|nr:MAG: RNA methyltransferase [Nitrospinota bacterium]